MNHAHRIHTSFLWIALSAMVACNEPSADTQNVNAPMNTVDANMISNSADMEAVPPQADAEGNDAESIQPDGTINIADMGDSTIDASAAPDQAMSSGLTCERTYECPFTEVCNNGLCDPSTFCRADGDCPLEGYLCNRERNRCVLSCRTQSHCPNDKVCISQRCVDGTRCSSDRNCEVGQVCETDGTGGLCTDSSPDALGDMGVAPDGGIWSCNDTLCEPRQRCGPHPSTNCDETDCLSAHGGICDNNCNCVPGLICKQTSQICVSCLNGLQCDAPERCISTGQCGLNIDLDASASSELSVLQTLIQCQANADNDACAQFSWTGTAPDLTRLKVLGCDDTIYASAMEDRVVIQDLLRCGSAQSPIIIDSTYAATDGSACVTQRSGYFIFHGCSPNQVPID